MGCDIFRINNCVGEENQFAFMLLLLYAFLLSLVTLVIQFIYFFQLDNCVNCQRVSYLKLFLTKNCQ